MKLKNTLPLLILLILLRVPLTEGSTQVTPEWKYTADTEVYTVKVGPDGQYVIAGDKSGRLYYFNSDGRLIWEYETGGIITSIDVTNNGRNIVVAVGYDSNKDGSPDYGKIVYLTNQKQVLWSYTSPAKDVFSSVSAGRDLIYAGGEGKILRFSYTGSRVATTLILLDLVEVDTFGDYLVVSHSPWFYKKGTKNYNTLFLFSGTFLKFIKEFNDAVVGTAISREYYVAVTGLHLDTDGKWKGSGNYYVYLYDLSGKLKWRHRLDAPAFDVDITSSGDLIAVGDVRGNVYVFDKHGHLIWKGNLGSSVYSVALSPDGAYLAVGTKDGSISLYRTPGILQISTEPSDAQVYLMVNAKYVEVGKTPLTLVIPSGTHTIKVVKDYYKPEVLQVSISPGDITKKHITLSLACGKINVYSNVNGAQVFIDGVLVGKTPLLNYRIPIGDHVITVKAEGYCGEFRKEVSITSLDPVTVTAHLNPCPAKLEINEPLGAEVYLNGDYKGTVPLSISIPPGTYELVLKKEGKRDYVTTISLSPGGIKKLSPNMGIDYVYYGIRGAVGIVMVVILTLLIRAYKKYKFKKNYKKLLLLIDSMKDKKLPGEAHEILDILEEKRKAAEEAYRNNDKNRLEKIKKDVDIEIQRIMELIHQYEDLKKKIKEDISKLLNMQITNKEEGKNAD